MTWAHPGVAAPVPKTTGPGHFHLIRNADRRKPYHNQYRKNDEASITNNLVRELFGHDLTEAQSRAILKVRRRAFMESIMPSDYVPDLSDRLRNQYKLAVLSNYPSGATILASLEQNGLVPYLDCVVVSSDVGFVKPHPNSVQGHAQTTRRRAPIGRVCGR